MKSQKLDKLPVGVSFFRKKDYSLLKARHLELKDYKTFMEACCRRIAKELVIGSREGWEMPHNLGKLRVVKNFNFKGCKNTITGEVYANYHTLGYVYKCRLWRDGRRVTLTPKYRISQTKEISKDVPIFFYKWNNHRENIDRYMARLLKENEVDFDER